MLVKGQETENLGHAGVVCEKLARVDNSHKTGAHTQGALLQSCLVVLASLLLWAFRTDDDSGNGYGFIA